MTFYNPSLETQQSRQNVLDSWYSWSKINDVFALCVEVQDFAVLTWSEIEMSCVEGSSSNGRQRECILGMCTRRSRQNVRRLDTRRISCLASSLIRRACDIHCNCVCAKLRPAVTNSRPGDSHFKDLGFRVGKDLNDGMRSIAIDSTDREPDVDCDVQVRRIVVLHTRGQRRFSHELKQVENVVLDGPLIEPAITERLVALGVEGAVKRPSRQSVILGLDRLHACELRETIVDAFDPRVDVRQDLKQIGRASFRIEEAIND